MKRKTSDSEISYQILKPSRFILSLSVTFNIKSYNHFYNILRLFDVLPNFSFTTNETLFLINSIYELPQDLPKDLRLRILGIEEI